MRAIWNAAEKDLRRYMRDPLALLLWLGIPLIVGGLVSVVIGGNGGKPPRAHLLVADEDGGRFSDLLALAIGQSEQGQFLQVEQVVQSDGRARIGRGEAAALLVIPKGFVAAVLQEEPTQLLHITNPAQQILPQMIEESLNVAADATFYMHRLVGPQLRSITEQASRDNAQFTAEQISKISVAINETVQRIEMFLFPPVIAVESSVDQQPAAKPTNLAQLYLPGIVFMALVFMAEGLSEDLWRERAGGTLRRGACSPTSLVAFLSGKLLASGVVILLSTAAILLAGESFYGMPLARLPLAAAWSTLAGLVMLLLFIVIQLHASSQRAGSVLTNSIVMPLLFVGGSFFPFEVMPHWMAAIGRWTPNGWALAHLKDILFGAESTASLATACCGLVILAAVLIVVSERGLRRVVSQG